MIDEKIEGIILENLVNNDEYFRQVMPHLKEEYFDNKVEKTILKFISKFAEKHNKSPNQRILSLLVNEYNGFAQDEYEQAKELVKSLVNVETNSDWLLERTEKFCRDKAIYNGIMKSISIIDGGDKNLSENAIPSLLQEALNITFDKRVGHSYIDDAESRYAFYHEKLERIPFKLEMFNKITNGGLPKKSLTVLLAPTGVGKSLFMCDYAAHAIKSGKNVLYITMEMAEERIAERIDCNLFDVALVDLCRMRKDEFMSRIDNLASKSFGKLIVKEYPTGNAHVGHFRSLLEDLKTKLEFIPDIIFVDYLNICSSQKYKAGGNHNSYTIVKSIAEEVRGLAVEYNVPVFSCTQSNRGGMNNSDIEMTDVSESVGLVQTVDLFFALMRTEELDKMGQVMVKQLKSRFGDINFYRKFIIGVELSKFKLHDVEVSTHGQISGGGTSDVTTKNTRDYSDLLFD